MVTAQPPLLASREPTVFSNVPSLRRWQDVITRGPRARLLKGSTDRRRTRQALAWPLVQQLSQSSRHPSTASTPPLFDLRANQLCGIPTTTKPQQISSPKSKNHRQPKLNGYTSITHLSPKSYHLCIDDTIAAQQATQHHFGDTLPKQNNIDDRRSRQ
jgi:hypothetical protein